MVVSMRIIASGAIPTENSLTATKKILSHSAPSIYLVINGVKKVSESI